MSDTTMVVVVLIATMAFQAAVSPPGGVWQDDSSTHKVGEAVMASTHPRIYKQFVRANTTAFISSVVTIFMITTGLPSTYRPVMGIATYAMWVSVASIVVSYVASVTVITPDAEAQSLHHVIVLVVAVSLTIFVMMYAGHSIYVSLKDRIGQWMESLGHATMFNFISCLNYWFNTQLEYRIS